jgi:hypothetical protein
VKVTLPSGVRWLLCNCSVCVCSCAKGATQSSAVVLVSQHNKGQSQLPMCKGFCNSQPASVKQPNKHMACNTGSDPRHTPPARGPDFSSQWLGHPQHTLHHPLALICKQMHWTRHSIDMAETLVNRTKLAGARQLTQRGNTARVLSLILIPSPLRPGSSCRPQSGGNRLPLSSDLV